MTARTVTSPRRGYTLIEMLAAIAIATALLMMVATTILALLRVERAGRERVAGSARLEELSRRFRDDARAAASAAIEGAALALDDGDGRVVRYEAGEGLVERVVRAEGDESRRERFLLPGELSARFEVEPGPPDIAALVCDRGPSNEVPGRPGAIRVEAEVGRHRRLVGEVGP